MGPVQLPVAAPPAPESASSGWSAIPPTGPVPDLNPAQRATVAAQSMALGELDYFQILQLEESATPAEIKRAFYRESRVYHPDRFFQFKDLELRDLINNIYKRVTEAYYVLRDDAKRRKYIADINGPQRTEKLRFSETAETETKQLQKKEVEEQVGSTPKGRQLYAAALKDIEAGQWSAAERNLKTALMYEASNSKYREKLNEVQKHIYALNASSPFKIK